MNAFQKNVPQRRMMRRKGIIPLPPIDAYPSRKQWEEACWEKLIAEKGIWPEYIITPHERRDIVLRMAAIHRIEEGKSYKEIGDELWLSPQTISALKKSLQEQEYRSYNDRGKVSRTKKVYSITNVKRPRRKLGAPHKTKYGTLYF